LERAQHKLTEGNGKEDENKYWKRIKNKTKKEYGKNKL
jgi:hypothetical protein